MEMKEHLERALRIISAMSVSGDNQDFAVAAKNEVRFVLTAMNKEKKEDPDDGGQSNQ